jgi:hypothetical protein
MDSKKNMKILDFKEKELYKKQYEKEYFDSLKDKKESSERVKIKINFLHLIFLS